MNIHSHGEGFISEKEIQEFFEARSKAAPAKVGKPKENLKEWFKANNDHPFTVGHMDQIGHSKLSCDTLTDHWFRWFLTTPVSENAMTKAENAYIDKNVALMDKEGARVFFAAASPFQDPFDFKRIIITTRAPLLVPAYNMVASVQEYPSVANGAKDSATALTDIVMRDMDGILDDSVEAYFDGKPFWGCAVVRNELLKISNVPDDNVLGIPQDRLEEYGRSIECVHGGLWMLLSEKSLGLGDHLLEFKVHSKNYQVQSKFLIKIQY